MNNPLLFPDLPPDIVLKARIAVLYETTIEMTRALSMSLDTVSMEYLKRGILDNQFFDAVEIYYFDKSGNAVGEATLSIDWDRHRVEVQGNPEIKVDRSQSISDQITGALPLLKKRVDQMKLILNVAYTEIRCKWRHRLLEDATRLAAAMRVLGLTDDGSDRPTLSTEGDDFVIELVPGSLKELRVNIRHRRK